MTQFGRGRWGAVEIIKFKVFLGSFCELNVGGGIAGLRRREGVWGSDNAVDIIGFNLSLGSFREFNVGGPGRRPALSRTDSRARIGAAASEGPSNAVDIIGFNLSLGSFLQFNVRGPGWRPAPSRSDSGRARARSFPVRLGYTTRLRAVRRGGRARLLRGKGDRAGEGGGNAKVLGGCPPPLPG